MTRVLIPGSFDPPTNGHLHLIERAAALFPEVCVLISVNSNKSVLLSQEERTELLRSMTAGFANVKVDVWDSLVALYAEQNGYHALLRGLRSEADFSYELDISNINHSLSQSLETLFLPTRLDKSIIRSSYVKELWSMGTVIDTFVPKEVAELLGTKLEHYRKQKNMEQAGATQTGATQTGASQAGANAQPSPRSSSERS